MGDVIVQLKFVLFIHCNCDCNGGTCIAPPLLEDRGRITESICILVPVDRVKQKCFQITMKRNCLKRAQIYLSVAQANCNRF